MGPSKVLFPVSDLSSSSGKLVNYAVVDAFTGTRFKGNPAAICLLSAWQESHWMQQVASEFNISQTAFLVRRSAATSEPYDGGSEGTQCKERTKFTLPDDTDHDFDIRWFTPCSEVDLCGHATLASAYLLFASSVVSGNLIHFHTQKRGVLIACRGETYSNGGFGNVPHGLCTPDKFLVELNFPILPSTECNSEQAILSSTFKDIIPVSFRKTIANDLLVELSSGKEVESLTPCFDEMRKSSARGIIVTGPAPNHSGYDFISRFFAPKVGIDEDPVCGQAHCALAAFWGKKLKKETLTAYQASRRGGTVHLRVDFEADRVYLQGEAVLVMSGVLLNNL